MQGKIILRSLVGSRAHGIEVEDSDYDYKSVYFEELDNIINPFGTAKRTQGVNDDMYFEFRHFVKQLRSCNPTAMETLYSAAEGNIYPPADGRYEPELGQELIALRRDFLSSKRIYDAHRGFALSQVRKFSTLVPVRRRKSLATYIRVVGMAIDFFETGKYSVAVPEKRAARLREIRAWSDERTMQARIDKHVPAFESRLEAAFNGRAENLHPDPLLEAKLLALARKGYCA